VFLGICLIRNVAGTNEKQLSSTIKVYGEYFSGLLLENVKMKGRETEKKERIGEMNKEIKIFVVDCDL
jgi:hypothetical protein